MILTVRKIIYIFISIQALVSFVLATPKLGIRPDFLRPTGRDIDKIIQSYSGIIKFQDGTIPLDKTRMTDAKLLNLCIVAYNEMIGIWRSRNLISSALPGAMAAIAYGDKIYFASSLRIPPGSPIKVKEVAQGSVRQIMDEALSMGLGAHEHGGGCSEINCIELLWSDNGQKDPEKGPPGPRVAIWVLPRGKKIDNNLEINAAPCTWSGRSGAGYGCADVTISAYGLDPIDKRAKPDAAGEDDWKFGLEPNPRPPCST